MNVAGDFCHGMSLETQGIPGRAVSVCAEDSHSRS